MQVQLNNLSRQYSSIKNEIDLAISEVLENTSFIGGELVSTFENEFAHFNNSQNCISCANGTDAIEIALQALGLQPGEEVLVPAITWISTAGAVRNMGGVPVFVDTDKNSLIDLKLAEEKITSNTKGIIPVHLFGLPVNMLQVMELAKKHQLFVIEDCAQAHNAEVEGKKVGTFGDIGTFSFYPGKNLGAYGDAGAIITDNQELDEKCRMIRNHGQKKKHEHLSVGRNSRLDTLQAAVLSVKLPHLDSWTEKRINIAELYNSLLADLPIKTTLVPQNMKHVYHLYVSQTEKRDELKKHLEEKGIQTAIHYPNILPKTPTFNESGNYDQAEDSTQKSLTLPLFPEMTTEEIKYVAESINSFF